MLILNPTLCSHINDELLKLMEPKSYHKLTMQTLWPISRLQVNRYESRTKYKH